MFSEVKPEEWLTEKGLTPRGQKTRDAYEKYITHLHSQPIPTYQVSRSLHLLQSVLYETGSNGYALPPHTINFCANNRCNLKCSYCDLSHGREEEDLSKNTKTRYNVIDPKVKHELPLELCKKVIDSVSWYKPTIRIPWTEALLYSELIPFIEYTKEKELPFSMLTNGLLLPKFAQRLSDLKIDALRVSLDGPERVHDSLCGVKGAFKQIAKGLKMMVDLRNKSGHDVQLGCYFTLNDKNYEYMGEFIDNLHETGLLDELYVGFFMFNYISKEMARKHNEEHADICGAEVEETSVQYVDLSKIKPKVLLDQKKYIEDKYISKGSRINFRPNFSESNLDFSLSEKPEIYPGSHCETHWHTLFINPEGHIKVLPQCILPPSGNIDEQPFLDIWNGDIMRDQRMKLQENGLYHGCAKCWSVYSNLEDTQSSWKDHSISKG